MQASACFLFDRNRFQKKSWGKEEEEKKEKKVKNMKKSEKYKYDFLEELRAFLPSSLFPSVRQSWSKEILFPTGFSDKGEVALKEWGVNRLEALPERVFRVSESWKIIIDFYQKKKVWKSEEMKTNILVLKIQQEDLM